VIITNVVCSSYSPLFASIIAGIPESPIEDVTLSNFYLKHSAKKPDGTPVPQPPELEQAYPEADMFGMTPAQGLYARHVDGLNASVISIPPRDSDSRPVYILEDVQNAMFNQISGRPSADAKTFALANVRNFRIASAQFVADTTIEHAAYAEL
jgi:hypothetical protein